MAKQKEIVTKHGVHVKIAADLGCHCNTVKNALKGKYNSPLAQRIRDIARKQYGGR